MIVFDLDRAMIEEYSAFSRSFTKIRAQDIRDQIDAAYASRKYWPQPSSRSTRTTSATSRSPTWSAKESAPRISGPAKRSRRLGPHGGGPGLDILVDQ